MIKTLFAGVSACALFSSSVLAAVPCNVGSPAGTFTEYDAIRYGANKNDELNLFTPTAAQLAALGLKRSPAIIVIHGHGTHYDDSTFTNICSKFASNGITCAPIEYPQVSGSDAWKAYGAVNCALRWLRANGTTYGYSTGKIGVYGGSFGGQQAMWQVATQAMTETPNLHYSVIEAGCPNAGTPAGVDAAVLQYGESDLTIPVHLDNQIPAGTDAGSATNAGSSVLAELSPITYLNAVVPQIVSVGDYDTTVNPVNTGMWVQRLVALGAKDIYVDPTNQSLCAIGAICGGQFSGMSAVLGFRRLRPRLSGVRHRRERPEPSGAAVQLYLQRDRVLLEDAAVDLHALRFPLDGGEGVRTRNAQPVGWATAGASAHQRPFSTMPWQRRCCSP